MFNPTEIGIVSPKFEPHDWGMYWFESNEDSSFREGHVNKEGVAFEWPFDPETKTSNGAPFEIN